MAINFDKALGTHEQALYLRERRNELLASNIANADTPGYKARDIDFRTALAGASENTVTLAATHSQHFKVSVSTGLGGDDQVKYRMPGQPSVDGNTVESHVEKAQYADNALRYQSTLQFLGSRFSSLKSVLQGGR